MSEQEPVNIPLTFEPPGPHAPGYLRRARIVAAMQEAAQSKQVTAGLFDDLVELASQYVSAIDGQPCTQEQAQEALWGLSQDQWDQIMAAMLPGKSPPPKEEPSGELSAPSPEE